MNQLHNIFENTLSEIGIPSRKLPTAIFYKAAFCIRFEIGGKEEIYLSNEVNPVYVNNARLRAVELFRSLPHRPNVLRTDSFNGENDIFSAKIASRSGLPAPDETVTEQVTEGGETYSITHFYWDLSKLDVDYEALIDEIINSDIGGNENLAGNVYFLNTEDRVLYYLYDDRGADIAANDKKTLTPIYHKYSDWILPYDKNKIDAVFGDNND